MGTPCRQSLHASVIEIKGVGEGKKERQREAETCLLLQKNNQKDSGNGQSLSIKGTFNTCIETTYRLHSDLAAIEP